MKYVHKDVQTQEAIEFDEDEESDGTRALFAFSGPWLDVTENERVLVVDELDTSLHPLLVHHLVKSLHHQCTKAQLIFTTHDTTLLSQSRCAAIRSGSWKKMIGEARACIRCQTSARARTKRLSVVI